MLKPSNAAAVYKATNQVVSNNIKPLNPPAIIKKSPVVFVAPAYFGAVNLPVGNIRVRSGLTSPSQVRWAHTDIKVPDFATYRRESTKNPNAKSSDSEESRKNFTYFLSGIATVATAYTAKATVTKFVMSMSASADVLALAKIEVKLDNIPEGKSVTFKWRGDYLAYDLIA